MEFDEFLKKYIGEFGRYQALIFLHICLVGIAAAFYITESVFQAGKMKYWCLPPDIPIEIHDNFTKEQLIRLVAPVEQQAGRQCDFIVREYASLTYESVVDILASNDSNSAELRTLPCTKWMYFSEEYDWTTVAEVCRRLPNLICIKFHDVFFYLFFLNF